MDDPARSPRKCPEWGNGAEKLVGECLKNRAFNGGMLREVKRLPLGIG
jgi:hypothetical protein